MTRIAVLNIAIGCDSAGIASKTLHTYSGTSSRAFSSSESSFNSASFASSLEDSDFYVPQTLLNEFIIPAAIASSALPDNPEGVALLESLIEELASP